MGQIVFNIAKGRVVELYRRVKSADPANCALVLVPIEASGLEADAVLIDKDDLAAVLAGATNEQATMGRKVLTSAQLAAMPAPDDANDRFDLSLPTTTWGTVTGNPIAKLLVAYDADTTGGTDADIIPLVMFDYTASPNNSDIQMSGGVFFRAA